MRGDQHDFIRAFAAADFRDHVAGGRVVANVGLDIETHAGCALRDEAREYIGVGG